MASAWAEFSREVFGEPYLVWHDGADFRSLPARWQEQPGLIGEMLRLGLGEGDPVAAQAVCFLARRGAAVSDFSGALVGARGTFRVRVAQALFALTGDQDLAAPICGVLTGDGHWGDRIDAAIALSAFAPAAAVVAALRPLRRARHQTGPEDLPVRPGAGRQEKAGPAQPGCDLGRLAGAAQQSPGEAQRREGRTVLDPDQRSVAGVLPLDRGGCRRRRDRGLPLTGDEGHGTGEDPV